MQIYTARQSNITTTLVLGNKHIFIHSLIESFSHGVNKPHPQQLKTGFYSSVKCTGAPKYP